MLTNIFLILWGDDVGHVCVQYLTCNLTFNGDDDFKGMMLNDRLHGKIIRILGNYHIISFICGCIHGRWKTYDRSSSKQDKSLKSVIHYKNNERHGKEIIYDNYLCEVTWKNGKMINFTHLIEFPKKNYRALAIINKHKHTHA